MKLRVLALDVDGTIAADGRLDGDVADAIGEARDAGVKTVLVSGRMLADIQALLPAPDLFDAIVAEGGAVVQMTNDASPIALEPVPDAALVAELHRRNVAHRSGLCTVEVDAAATADVLASLHAIGSPHGISFDRGTLMVLPHGVSKASGLSEAVWRLGASLHNTVAIGDAADDRSMLDVCEVGAAVAWGDGALQRSADHVVGGRGPTAVADYIRTLTVTNHIPPHRLRLGTRETGESVTTGESVRMDVRPANVLVTGDPRSGKTWLVSLHCEQLILRRYAICVLDPEGDYTCLEVLPGVVVLRVRQQEPPLPDLERWLRQPALSLVVDLSALATEAKPAAIRSLLQTINTIRRTLGVPHHVVLDEAHYFLHHEDADLPDSQLGGCALVTYRSSDLAPGVIDACDTIVATRIADRRVAAHLLRVAGCTESASGAADALANLAIGEALLLRGSPEGGRGIIRFSSERRVTNYARHRQKYVDVGVPPGREFVFTRDGHGPEGRVRTLRELLEALPAVADDVMAGHLARGDFHRWIEDVFGDHDLGEGMRRIECGDATNARERIARAIRDRYLAPESEPCDSGQPDGPSVAAS